jgi:RNA polymerase sigma-70 factor, ECF subfamily
MSVKVLPASITHTDRTASPPALVAGSNDAVSDRDLLDRIARGEVAALDVALARYWPLMVSYLAGLLGARDAAEDVAQETFYRLWERRDRLRADGSLRGFLYQVAHNLAITEQRRIRARTRSLEAVSAEAPRFTPPAETADDVLAASLEHAIGALPARRREILILRSVHELSYKEIAHALGIAPQTVGNQFSAALATLRRTLGHLLP